MKNNVNTLNSYHNDLNLNENSPKLKYISQKNLSCENSQQSLTKIMINQNQTAHQSLLQERKLRLETIKLGGGLKNIQKQHERGKLVARERIAYLIDDNTEFLEIGAFVGYEMYAEHGGCPAGGTVGGLGYVSGRLCVIVANDQTVKAGAYFPITGKKNLRLQEIAMQNHLPIVLFTWSKHSCSVLNL